MKLIMLYSRKDNNFDFESRNKWYLQCIENGKLYFTSVINVAKKFSSSEDFEKDFKLVKQRMAKNWIINEQLY